MYRGAYSLNEATGTVKGNPARSAAVQDILKAVKNRDKANGSTRNHAEAMSIDEMKKLMDWSKVHFSRDPNDLKFDNAHELVMAAKHYLMRAFASSGFTLWTRYLQFLIPIYCSMPATDFPLAITGTSNYVDFSSSIFICGASDRCHITAGTIALTFLIERDGPEMGMMGLCVVSVLTSILIQFLIFL